VADNRIWLEVDMGVGDTRLPVTVAARLDGLIEIDIGSDEVLGTYGTVLDLNQVQDVIDVLTLVRDAAKEVTDDE
jgi:hypothetical protein